MADISPKVYARAFLASLKEVKDRAEPKAVKNFIKVLQKTNGLKKGGKIIRAVESQLVHDAGGRMIRVESARRLTKKQEEEMKNLFRREDTVEFALRPELIAGVRVSIDSEWSLDNTLRRKLEKLFAG